MIKKYKFLLITILLFSSETLAFSPKIEQEIYVGCYSNSKQYIEPEKAKKYCLCKLKNSMRNIIMDKLIKFLNKKQKKLLKPQNLYHCFVKNKSN